MNLQQRLHQLEQTIAPKIKDLREPLLIEFTGREDYPNAIHGLLCIFESKKVSTQKLNSRQLAEFKSSGQYDNLTNGKLNGIFS